MMHKTPVIVQNFKTYLIQTFRYFLLRQDSVADMNKN